MPSSHELQEEELVEEHKHSHEVPKLSIDESEQTSSEKGNNTTRELLDEEGGIPPAISTFWASSALFISYVSIVCVAVLGVVGLIVSRADNSVSMLGYAFDQFLDVITSLLILWRFRWCSFTEMQVSKFEEQRDKQAGVLIAFLFVLLSQVIGIESVIHLVEESKPESSYNIMIVALISIVLFFVLAAAKLKISIETQSSSLRKDAWVTLLSSLLSIGILASALIYRKDQSYWWMDAVVAIVLSLWLLWMGLKTLWYYDWWEKSFWRSIDTRPKTEEREMEEL